MESNLIQYIESPEFKEATSKWPRLITFKEKSEPLSELLYKGACQLFEKNEIVSGQDIAALYLEASAIHLSNLLNDESEKRSTELNNTSLSYHLNNQTIDCKISQKVAYIAIQLPDSEVGLKKFLGDSLKILKPTILSRTILHEILAKSFWQKKDYPNSRYNYLYCANLENAKDISQLLVEYHAGSANKYEIDLFLTQFIFQFLCIQNPLDGEPKPGTSSSNRPGITTSTVVIRKTRTAIKNIAEKIFTSYILLHPQLTLESVPYTSLPLLNFTHFIISMLNSTNESETFTTLSEVYKVNWSRDPNYELYLTKIGHMYFGIPAPQRSGGFFDNILSSLFEEGDNDMSEQPTNDAIDDLD